MALIKEKTLGEVRYFTYWLRFPDGEEWVDQEPFVHDLRFELSQTIFNLDPQQKNDLLTKGETFWKDNNSVEHHVKIESKERLRVWGTKRGQANPRFRQRGQGMNRAKRRHLGLA